ncbi:hypothetical protein ACLOJK_025930 [Asimina triloba]
MQKLQSWRRLPLPLQTLTFFRPQSQSISHHRPSPPSDADDPPFAPLSCTEPRKSSSDHSKFPLHSDLPFDFRYSYSESNPSVHPIGFREPPRFSPFGPGRLDRTWNGVSAPANDGEGISRELQEEELDWVMGDPLTEEETEALVEKYRHSDCARQINLGKGGVTHNMLDDVHNHWKRAEAVRIKCLGVPTLDMDNVRFQLEEKTGGKVIHQDINILLLYRGRNYDPKRRPVIPLMLWKPRAPIYPRLVQHVADGLTFEETKEMRNKGLNAPSLMKLTRNGVYVNVVARVRETFKTEEVIKLDCTHVDTSDCKKIGVKLRSDNTLEREKLSGGLYQPNKSKSVM